MYAPDCDGIEADYRLVDLCRVQRCDARYATEGRTDGVACQAGGCTGYAKSKLRLNLSK